MLHWPARIRPLLTIRSDYWTLRGTAAPGLHLTAISSLSNGFYALNQHGVYPGGDCAHHHDLRSSIAEEHHEIRSRKQDHGVVQAKSHIARSVGPSSPLDVSRLHVG